MAKKTYTGNDLLDRLMEGPYVRNPQYNPKTKAGRTQPSYLLDTSAGDINSGMFTNTARAISNLSFTGRDLGLTNEEIDEYGERGISISPYNSFKDINAALAKNQSGLEQFGNFLMQAGVGEVILGTLEGLGNIADGVINTFTGDNYGVNPYTEFMHEAKENLKKNFEIYREDPDASWAFGDFGWWMDNAVSIASTASLMIPGAGWARGLSYIGKLSKLSKLGRMTSKLASRGIAKATTKAATRSAAVAGDFGAIKSVAAKAGRIDKTIRNGAGIVTTAALSRAGEGYMEAREVYNDVYTNSKENIEGMIEYDKLNGTNEFDKFIANNPEFKGMNADDIAKEIAKKSANKTFYNDYWMLLMDIPQFKALGSIWGKGAKRASKASERIAAANQKKLLAGATSEQLIKDNLINRTKEGIKYALKNPLKSFTALELGEGFEEMYQGIQTEKGMEVAAKYFDPSLTTRSLDSYLTDPSIWEQGFWGIFGGVGFNKIGAGLQKGSKAIQGLWNKKHMTAEDYEQWKRSADKIALEQINSTSDRVKNFVTEMEQINSGTNPYNFVRDKATGQYIIKDGNVVNETIDEDQKSLLREHAIKKFIDGATVDAVDSGTLDLMKDIIGSSEFDQYIANNGLRLSSEDKALSKQVVDRMDEVSGLYYAALNDVNSLNDETNPYVTIAVARNITNNKLRAQDYDSQLFNVDKRIEEANDTNTDYSVYEEKVMYEQIQTAINDLKRQYTELEQNKELSDSARQLHRQEIEKTKKTLLNLLSELTTQGALDNIKKDIEAVIVNPGTDTVFDALDEFFNTYYKSLMEKNYNVPTETIDGLIKQKAAIAVRRAFTESKIPVTKEDYENIYNEFSYSMDNMMIKKVKDGIDKVKNYLISAKDFDKALDEILKENTNDDKLNDVLKFIKYGYFDKDAENGRNKGQMVANLDFAIAIEEARRQRKEIEERKQEAKEQGVELPSSEESNEDGVPSTGSQTQEDTTDTIGATDTTNTNNTGSTNPTLTPVQTVNQSSDQTLTENPLDSKITPEPTDIGVQTTPDDKVVVDDTVPVDSNPLDTGMGEQELKEQSAIAEGYETDSLKASLDASKYVMQIGFRESGRIDNITKALAEGDTSKYEAFIKEIVDFLIEKGYNKNLAEVTAKKAFSNTVASFAAMDSKSSFGRLAQQLAMGFGQEGAKKYSITELIEGKGLDEIVEAFLNEYSKLVNNSSVDGVHIINMESLFNFILSNSEIDIRTATYIYNNIGKFIAAHDGSKFKFTGFSTSHEYSAKEFFDRLNEDKAQTLASMDNMHFSPIEKDQRTPDYTKALVAAANGAPTYVKLEGTSSTNISIYVDIKKGNKTVPVKIGILRTVQAGSDFSNFSAVSHYSGFSNSITIDGTGQVHLDCDFLFETLINKHTTDSSIKELFDEMVKYYINVRSITNKLHSRQITPKEAQEELSKTMSLDTAKRILTNPLIAKLLQTGRYKFYKEESLNEITKAKKLVESISSILFYGHKFDTADPTSYDIDDMSIDTATMKLTYENWKQIVHKNYLHTYELQKGLTSADSKVNINLNVSYHTVLKTISNKADYVNIEDAGFDIDKNSPNYTPLIIVDTEGHMKDEDGNDYGLAPIEIMPYSMGFLVHNENDVKLVAYFNSAQELNGSEIHKAVDREIANLITKQLYNTIENEHDANFDEIINKLIELFNPKGTFIFNNFNSTFRVPKDKSFGTIGIKQGKDKNGKDIVKNLITFYLKNVDGTNSHAIGLYIPRLGKQIPITSIADTKTKDGQIITEQEIKDALNSVIQELTSSIKLNKSLNVFQNRATGNAQSRFYRRENGKFVINLGGKDYVYENYGDFMLQNRAFNTNVDGSDGSFVNRYLNEKNVTIDTRVRDTSQDVAVTNTFVTDLLFNDKNPKRKTVDTKDVLEAAGVPQDKIDVLLGTNSGMPIVTKRITADPKDDSDTNAYYSKSDNTVYVTQKGAAAMNNNPTNALRLILHENLHRLFHNKRNYNDAQRERILEELKEVYYYTIEQLKKDKADGKISESLYNSIIDVFSKATVSNDEQVQMEEFLMECLTQPAIANYLNNTEYHSEVNIDGIPQRKKSIFQKIMDILLDLLGINTNRIKNNSILAREYMILSRTDNPTIDNTSNKSTKSDNAKLPVEGIPINKPAKEPAPKPEEVIDITKSETNANKTDASNEDIAGSEMIQKEPVDDDFNFDDYDLEDDSYLTEDYDVEADIENEDEPFKASTDLIEYNDQQYTKEEQEILKNAPRDNKGRLLAPNGKVSNLTEKQYAQVRTKAFKDWFGDWEIVDSFNKLLNNDFTFNLEAHNDEYHNYSIGAKVNAENPLNNLCIGTSAYCIGILEDLGFKPHRISFIAKSPVMNTDISHKVSLFKYNGKLYIYDMPQTEFIFKTDKTFGNNNQYYEGVITNNYKPRLIELTEENLINNYGTSVEEAKRVVEDQTDNNWKDSNEASKVVDENGEPLVVYHTRDSFKGEDFNIFDTTIEGRETAIYSTNSKEMSSSYWKFGNSRKALFDLYSLSQIGDIDKTDIDPFTGKPFKDSVSHHYTLLTKVLNELGIEIDDTKNVYTQKEIQELYNNLLEQAKLEDLKALFVSIKNPLIVEGDGNYWNEIIFDNEKLSTRKIEDRFRNSKYDGIIFKTIKDYGGYNNENVSANDVYAVYKPNQVKSATDNIGTFDTNNPDIRYSKTELISPAEIYAPAIANGSTDNAYGIQIVGNMRSYVNTFPLQYRGNIEQLLADDELNYTCQ